MRHVPHHFAANGRSITACGKKALPNHEGGQSSNNSDETTCTKCKKVLSEKMTSPVILARVSEDARPIAVLCAGEALRRATVLAKSLGEGWAPRVWENLGWWWEAIRGPLGISPAGSGSREAKPNRYFLTWNGGIVGEGKTPKLALKDGYQKFMQVEEEAHDKYLEIFYAHANVP